MKGGRVLVIILIALTSFGFTWGGKKQDSKREDKKKVSVPAQSNVPDHATKEDLNPYFLPEISKVPNVPVVRPIQNPLPDIALPETNVGLPKAGYGDPSIVRIQEQIKEIIRFNDDLKTKRQDQIREIQRIRDQAHIHQKILDDIKKYQKAKPEIKQSDTDKILQQEKIRVIQNETAKNREFINSLHQGKSTAPNQDAKAQAAVS